jgi:hypothetical protein
MGQGLYEGANLEHRAEKWRRFSVKAMRKQEAMANEPIHEIGSLL